MSRDFKLYIEDIFDAIKSIQSFTKGINFDAFFKDDKTISAVVRKFEVMGEATKRIPDAVKAENPDIPWKEMAKMRDKLIHHYAEVNVVLLYDTIVKELPLLKKQIHTLLKKI